MTDIDQLRELADALNNEGIWNPGLIYQAADELEQLRQTLHHVPSKHATGLVLKALMDGRVRIVSGES